MPFESEFIFSAAAHLPTTNQYEIPGRKGSKMFRRTQRTQRNAFILGLVLLQVVLFLLVLLFLPKR